MNILCSRGLRCMMRLAGGTNYKVANIIVRDTQSDANPGATNQGASQL
jgi:hypothetical protein